MLSASVRTCPGRSSPHILPQCTATSSPTATSGTALYPSGGELDSPLSFVRELKIVQEEIYDDPTGNP